MIDTPEWMEFTTKQHDSFAIDEQRLVIPSHLHQSSQYTDNVPEIQSSITYVFLQQIPLHRIWMLRKSEAIELVLDSSTSCLSRQQGRRTERYKLHGVWNQPSVYK